MEKLSKRDEGENQTINHLIETRDKYLAKAEKYRDPDYFPSYAVSPNSDIQRDKKIEYWEGLAKKYDVFIESERAKTEERKNRKPMQ